MGDISVSTASVVNSTAFGATTGAVGAGSPYVIPSANVFSVLSEGDWIRLCDATDGLVSGVYWPKRHLVQPRKKFMLTATTKVSRTTQSSSIFRAESSWD